MDIGANQIVTQIASSTSQYLGEYLPVIVLVAGIALALGVMDYLISMWDKENYAPEENVNGFERGEYMANFAPGLNKRDRDYYRSKYYPGNDNFVGFNDPEYKKRTGIDED